MVNCWYYQNPEGVIPMFTKFSSFLKKRPAAAERFFSYAQILLGALIAGAAYPLFMTPNRIAPGGMTGIAPILNHLYRFPDPEPAPVPDQLPGHGPDLCVQEPAGNGVLHTVH